MKPVLNYILVSLTFPETDRKVLLPDSVSPADVTDEATTITVIAIGPAVTTVAPGDSLFLRHQPTFNPVSKTPPTALISEGDVIGIL